MDGGNSLIVLCGFMGCGKTTLGKALAAKLGYAFADTDDMILSLTNMSLPQIFSAGGEAYFRNCEHEAVIRAASMTDTVLSTGGGVMTFERNAQLLARRGKVIHIHRPFHDCYAAILRRKNRPLASDKTCEELLSMYNARFKAYERCASFTVHNFGTPEETVRQILTCLND